MTRHTSRKNIFPLGTFLLLFIGCCMTSCQQGQDQESAADRLAFKAPVTKPLQFTEAQDIEWEEVPADSTPSPQTYTLNVEKLPTRPFIRNDFKPMKAPMKEYALNFEALPENTLKFDTIPIAQAGLKTAVLRRPKVTKMEVPRLVQGVDNGILQFSQAEGLPSNEIKKILNNGDGTYWIATYDGGLCLYNGENIYTYDFKQIFGLSKDRQGRLLLGTGNGVVVLDFEKKIETSFGQGNLVVEIYCDPGNTLWMTSWRDGLYTMNGEMTVLKKVANEGFNGPIRILEDAEQNMWVSHIGNPSHLTVIAPDQKSFKNIVDTDDFTIGSVPKIFKDRKGTIWATALQQEPKILGFNLKTNTVQTLDKDNGYTSFGRLIEEDERGRLWIFHQDSAYILSPDKKQFKTLATMGSVAGNGRMGDIAKDGKGVFWLGTQNRGVELIDPNGPLQESLDITNGLTSDAVWSIEETHRGDIWLGTNGIDLYDPEKGSIKTISPQMLKHGRPNTIYKINEFEQDRIFISDEKGFSIFDRDRDRITYYGLNPSFRGTVRDFLIDEKKNFWLATNTEGILVYDKEKGAVKKLKVAGSVLPGTQSNKLVEDGNGNYWSITGQGLVFINPSKNTIQQIGISEGLVNKDIATIMLRNKTELWAATTGGLSVIDLAARTITNFGKEEGLDPTVIYELTQRNGIVYMGSENGLIRVQVPANKEDPWFFYNFGSAQGFDANDYSANASKLLKNGTLWLPAGPATQINILAPETGVDTTLQEIRVTGISILDQDRSFESFANYETLLKEKDTLWDTDGKNYFLKGALPPDTSYVFEHKIQWDSLPFPFTLPLGLKFPYDQNYLRFQYANLSILNRDKIAFRYKLEGHESYWNYPGNKSESKNYFNLPPGQYTFKVETREITGNWGSPAQYTFNILPPWWQTWWAYLLYAIVAIGSIWGIVQYRSRQLKRKNRLLEEKVALRTKELRKTITSLKSTQAQLIQSEKMASLGELTAGIAHEIQNPLNFVNNFSEVNTELIDEMQEELKAGNTKEAITLSNDIRENQKKINHHGRRADAIVKGMLQHSRNSNSEKEATDINALADEYLRLAYHGLRAKDKSFNAKLETDFDSSIKKINIVAQDMGRVILNLITNAFYVVKQKKEQQKEPYEPTVSVRTKKNKDTISISVKDNGNGIPQAIKEKIFQPFFTTKPSGEGTGLGLSLSYDIVKSHGGQLKVETKVGEGTEFTIILPMVQTNKS